MMGIEVEVVQLPGVELAVTRRAALGGGPARRGLLFLHGWPGTHADWQAVYQTLALDGGWDGMDLLAPDLRGYGGSSRPPVDLAAPGPFAAYTPAAHVADMAALVERYGLREVVVAGFDLGANLAQGLARLPDTRVVGLVLCDPIHPAARVAAAGMKLEAETWYQQLHVQSWAADLIAHDRSTLEIYLRHFYTHWWGAGAVDETHFQDLVDQYARPGAFEASIAWYRSRAGTRTDEVRQSGDMPPLALPVEVLWGEVDPVSPVVFADSLPVSFTDAHLTRLPGVGHFVPLEAPAAVVAACNRLRSRLDWR